MQAEAEMALDEACNSLYRAWNVTSRKNVYGRPCWLRRGEHEKYQAYLIDDDGRIAGFDKMSCRNDAEALRKASHFAGGRKLEVWTGARLVTAVPNGGRHESGAAS